MTDGGSVGGEPDARGPGTGVDASTLLGDDAEPFEDALSGAVPGPLSVVGSPYAGRERVLDAATERLGATRIRLDPGDDVATFRAELGEGPVVVDDCQHLYERRIGGFDRLESFLDSLVGVETPVVTGWNRYAWQYLVAAMDIDRSFPVRVDVGPVGVEDLSRFLLDRSDESPRFTWDDPERSGLVAVRRYPVAWRGYEVSVPVPVPDPAARASLRGGDDRTPADAFFERLATVSAGNVGVATAIWESRSDAERRPGDVAAGGADLDADREEAFCLRIVLSKERVERTELAETVGDRLDRVLGRLRREGVLTVEDGLVSLEPAAVPTVTTATERGRIL